MSRIIFAMKTMPEDKALDIAKQLSGKVWGFKLNTMLFGNLGLIKKLKEFGNVMADAKVFEIPEDMENSVRLLINAGADIVTVHCAPLWEAPSDLIDKVVGVTVLTSFDDHKTRLIFGCDIPTEIYIMMSKTAELGYRWHVCSASDLREDRAKSIIKRYGTKPICPSIRLSDQEIIGDDQNQSRKASPSEAMILGAELIVVGRPILRAEDPIAVVDRINYEVNQGLEQIKNNS